MNRVAKKMVCSMTPAVHKNLLSCHAVLKWKTIITSELMATLLQLFYLKGLPPLSLQTFLTLKPGSLRPTFFVNVIQS